MVKIFFGKTNIGEIASNEYADIVSHVSQQTKLSSDEFYLEHNGKLLHTTAEHLDSDGSVTCQLRVFGGKGGFGSMLRAIGAQIEKTTNREACRDLSGRRLRDINEEKRLKAWLDKQGEREREAEQRKKKKIEKLLAVPKHEFKDEEYEEARSKLTEKVSDAVEEGFKKAEEAKKQTAADDGDKANLKRKGAVTKTTAKKGALWIDDDLSGSDASSSDESDEEPAKKAIKA